MIGPLEAENVDQAEGLVDGSPAQVQAELERLRAAAAHGPLLALAAFQRGRPVAVVRGAFTALGYQICAVHADDKARTKPALAELLEYVVSRFPGSRLEAHVPSPLAPAGLAAALERCGFGTAVTQLHFYRPLRGRLRTAADPFHYIAYRAAGRAQVTEVLKGVRSSVGAHPVHMDAVDLMESLLFTAGAGHGEPDTSLWFVAALEERPAGLVLCQLANHGDTGTGTLLFLGLLPAYRGRGLGTALHAHAMEVLRVAGAERYEDATTVDNVAMQRVFARNSCRHFRTTVIYTRPPDPTPSYLESFDALAALLTRQGFAYVVHDDAGWLTVTIRSGHLEAPVDVVWLRDLGLVHVVGNPSVTVPPTAYRRVAAELCVVNERLDVPGFAIDRGTGSLRYQVVLPTMRDGSLATDTLMHMLKIAVSTTERSRGRWLALVGQEARRSLLDAPISSRC